MKYKEFIMDGYISGEISGTFHNREQEWKQRKEKLTELIFKDIGSKHLKLYLIYNQFFLVTENNDYIGSLEFSIDSYLNSNKKIIKISSSFKTKKIKLNVSFYKIMFSSILSTSIKEIHSDTNLSTQAFNSYLKLRNEKVILSNRKKLNLDNFIDDPLAYIIVKESKLNIIKDSYEKIFNSNMYLNNELIQEGVHRKEFDNYHQDLDFYIFGSDKEYRETRIKHE